ncbi:MAG: SlyX family protein [Kiritimatiellales bacterium]|nr:SlyX family protein [Kiritimatiellota bacterium]MBL7011465.1 SlyX family protein [Kiritimatiellales bacterium]
MEDRLTKLEMLYSDQSKTIEEMSGEMFQQQREITSLKQQIEELKEQMEASSNEIGGHERPPHY